MKFFCFQRDRPGSGPLRLELLDKHWSYRDRYASEMIARGPAFVGDAITGSVHIVDLPDSGAYCPPRHDPGQPRSEQRPGESRCLTLY